MTESKGLFRTVPPGYQYLKPEPTKPVEAMTVDEQKMEYFRLRETIELPHLYGWKWYPWAATFRDSTNAVSLLCAGNQASKSSTQIRKAIIWATDQNLWPSLWDHKPVQFWYLYPSQKVVNAEFETKWKLFLPKGEMKDDPYYGWKTEKKGGDIIAIHFFSGVHIYFKTYSQNVEDLQSGTVDALFCDEELPVDLFDELMLRISASSGYFSMVFTATKGQEFWRKAMDPTEDEVREGKESLPQAFKMCVSLYDCMTYEDGTKSHWTLQKIKDIEARCSTHKEVLKRVYGKFVVVGGLKYECFDVKKHFTKGHPIPPTWYIFVGADIGGGSRPEDDGVVVTERGRKHKGSHKAALCYIAVSPDFRKLRVIKGWRGDGVVTTAGDVFNKHQEMWKKWDFKNILMGRFYDWANKDFGTIAQRAGEPFEKADKGHETGEDIINTLFKHDMLKIHEDEEGENYKLTTELATLKKKADKRDAEDDFSDAMRYGITKIPIDWSYITGAKGPDNDGDPMPEEAETALQREMRERRHNMEKHDETEKNRIEDEFSEWNDAYGN